MQQNEFVGIIEKVFDEVFLMNKTMSMIHGL